MMSVSISRDRSARLGEGMIEVWMTSDMSLNVDVQNAVNLGHPQKV